MRRLFSHSDRANNQPNNLCMRAAGQAPWPAEFLRHRLASRQCGRLESRIAATVMEMRPMSDQTPFASECPKCGHDRLLTGYAWEELRELLRSGAEIEAYCISCDAHWPISTEERADLALALSRSK
jgi:hypothetical protein